MSVHKTTISQVSKEVSELEKTIQEVKEAFCLNVPVTQRFNISYLFKNKGESILFSQDETWTVEEQLTPILARIGVDELAVDGAQAEFTSAVLSYFIDDMINENKDLVTINGSDIRYYIKSKTGKTKGIGSIGIRWKTLSDDVKVIIHRLPETQEDREIAQAKTDSLIFNKLIEIGVVDKMDYQVLL